VGLGEDETPGVGKGTVTLQGMLRASLQLGIWGGKGGPAAFCR